MKCHHKVSSLQARREAFVNAARYVCQHNTLRLSFRRVELAVAKPRFLLQTMLWFAIRRDCPVLSLCHEVKHRFLTYWFSKAIRFKPFSCVWSTKVPSAPKNALKSRLPAKFLYILLTFDDLPLLDPIESLPRGNECQYMLNKEPLYMLKYHKSYRFRGF